MISTSLFDIGMFTSVKERSKRHLLGSLANMGNEHIFFISVISSYLVLPVFQ